MFRDCGNNFAIPKFVIENGANREIYKIKDITKDEGVHFVKIESRWKKYNVGLGDITFKVKQRTTKTITLPSGHFTNSLKVGRNLISFKDKSLEIKDCAYLYRGNLFLNLIMAVPDKAACKSYIEEIPGLCDEHKLDRFIFKIMLIHECKKRNIGFSFSAWRNLQNIVAKGEQRN